MAAPPTAPPHCAATNMTDLTGLILLVINIAVVKAGFICPPVERKNSIINCRDVPYLI